MSSDEQSLAPSRKEMISVFLDAYTGVSVVPGSGVAYFEGNDNVFLGAESTGP